MSVRCLMNGLEVNYPCSPVCPLFGDCVTAFDAARTQSVRTNADRIRAMSDEELAEFMAERYDREHTARILGELFGRGYAPDQTMRRALHEKVRLQWLGWLRQPIKEGEGDGEA